MQAPVCELCAEMESDGGNDAQGIYDFVSVDCEAFGNRLYSVFSPNRKHSLSPSDSSTTTNSNSSQSPNNDNIMAAATTKQALNFIIQNHQDLVNRHNICLNHLRDATREVDALRRENTSLHILNRELNDRLSLMIQSNVPPRSLSPNFQEISLMQGFGALSIGDTASGRDGFVESPSPTSVMESNVMEMPMEPIRVALPKSISVRSDGYLKTNPVSVRSGGPAAGADCRPRNTIRVQSADPAAGKQKVYVQGGKKVGNAVELEVYNQGMLKTELCNKWQETGACPYGDHCQFAHGIEELRPVLRHPRYKTEVCRMVLAGDPCPYGHRCHFRHALTEQEKEKMMMSPGPDEEGWRII